MRYWVTFVDPKAPEDKKFQGVAIVDASSEKSAILVARLAGSHAGYEATAAEMPEYVILKRIDMHRLLRGTDLKRVREEVQAQRRAESGHLDVTEYWCYSVPVIGLNEAHILSAIADGDERSLVDVVHALKRLNVGREIREATAYMALQRMALRDFVEVRKERVVSRDGKPREIGMYKITSQGRSAVQEFARETAPLTSRLSLGKAGA